MFSIHDIHRRRDAILACAREHGAIRIRIFGSLSRGEENGRKRCGSARALRSGSQSH